MAFARPLLSVALLLMSSRLAGGPRLPQPARASLDDF